MNPLLSFWIKVQPLSGSFGSHAWKAVGQTSALAPSTGDDAMVSKSATTYSWAFDYFKSTTSRFASGLYWDVFYWASSSSSWPLFTPVINRMHDAPIIKPASRAACEGYKRYTTRKVDTAKVKHITKIEKRTSLQQSQLILQHQDYINYQIPPPPIRRRNSKEWVPQYKKERIDKINYNNVFGGPCDTINNEIPTLPPISAEEGRTAGMEKSKYFIPSSPTSSTTSTAGSPETVESMPLLSQQPSPTTSSSVTINKISDSGPSAADVICGRGGKANTHAGNISFRDEAKKLRSWYESSSKSEKFTISSFLVDLVKERGGRFLKRDPKKPEGWSEVEDDEVRKKASQALREGRMKSKRQ